MLEDDPVRLDGDLREGLARVQWRGGGWWRIGQRATRDGA
jgi:hypothetical protein